MKKIVALMLVLVMALSVCACAGVETNGDNTVANTDDSNKQSEVIKDSNNDGQIEVGTVDDVEVNEADVLRSKVLLDVFHGRTAAFFRLFPVKDARTGSDVAAHGCQTDLHLIIQHGKALFPIYLDGVLG